jgi:hypothetical protein
MSAAVVLGLGHQDEAKTHVIEVVTEVAPAVTTTMKAGAEVGILLTTPPVVPVVGALEGVLVNATNAETRKSQTVQIRTIMAMLGRIVGAAGHQSSRSAITRERKVNAEANPSPKKIVQASMNLKITIIILAAILENLIPTIRSRKKDQKEETRVNIRNLLHYSNSKMFFEKQKRKGFFTILPILTFYKNICLHLYSIQ